jgi:Mn2+/Fe2+ NRAMP family transporter
VLRLMVGLLIVANVINLGADLGGMADALGLFIGGPSGLYVVLFALVCVWLEVFSRYDRYVAVLKWTTLSLLTYVATVLAVKISWGELLFHLVVPEVAWDREAIIGVVAVLGTTISPYLMFWQASEEAEDERVDGDAEPLLKAPGQAPRELRRIHLDTYIGMAYSNVIALFIIITTAATLHEHGITYIETSAQAAAALKPIAGPFAFAVFALGIIGTGLLAIPVLAGSAAYAVGEALDWPVGLARLPREAKAFYGTIAVSTLLGIAITFIGLDPIATLFWSAVINGVIAVPLMAMMMLMSENPAVMGPFRLPRALAAFGWLATAVMGATVIAMAWAILA